MGGAFTDPLVAQTAKPGLSPRTALSENLALCLNLITATLGCGILSLPWATAGASLISAILLTLVILAVNGATNMVLVYAAEKHHTFDLGALLGCLPAQGKVAKAFCEMTIWLTVFMCLVGYLIVVADSSELLLPELPRAFRVFMSAGVILPLCFLDQKHLAFSSTLSIAANIYVCVLLATLCFSGWRKPSEDEAEQDFCLLGYGEGTVTMVSALMQAAVVQMCILPMYEEMVGRSPERFAVCLTFSFSFVALLFATFSAVAYFVLGPTVSSNVLLDLPAGIFDNLARVAMAIAVIGVYPILLSSMVAPIKHRNDEGSSRQGHVSEQQVASLYLLQSVAPECIQGSGRCGSNRPLFRVCRSPS